MIRQIKNHDLTGINRLSQVPLLEVFCADRGLNEDQGVAIDNFPAATGSRPRRKQHRWNSKESSFRWKTLRSSTTFWLEKPSMLAFLTRPKTKSGSLHRVIKQRNSHSGHRIKTNSAHLEIMDSDTHRLISLANHLTDPYVARELPGGIY
jgi:hypothetical protein